MADIGSVTRHCSSCRFAHMSSVCVWVQRRVQPTSRLQTIYSITATCWLVWDEVWRHDQQLRRQRPYEATAHSPVFGVHLDVLVLGLHSTTALTSTHAHNIHIEWHMLGWWMLLATSCCKRSPNLLNWKNVPWPLRFRVNVARCSCWSEHLWAGGHHNHSMKLSVVHTTVSLLLLGINVKYILLWKSYDCRADM